MIKAMRRLWRDPVWSKVIATAIVAAAPVAATWFHWWPAIVGALGWCWSAVTAKTLVPNWLLGVLILAAAAWILVLVLYLWQSVLSPSEAPWKTYTADTFFELRWRWNWVSNGMRNLTPYCPSCDCQVVAVQAGWFRGVPTLEFRCDECDRVVATSQESLETLANKVERLVDQRIRMNTWRQS